MLTKDVDIVNGMVRQKTTDQIYKGFMIYKSGKNPAQYTARKDNLEYQGSMYEVERQIDKYWEIEDAKIVLGKKKNAGDRKPKHPRWRIKGDRYSTRDVKAGQTIIIEVNDPDDSLLKFLEWLKTTANMGHSFGVLCDPETLGKKAPTFGFDGDGSFRIENIIVNKDSTIRDSDNQFDIRNIEKETKVNNNFRKVLFTADRMQLVIMCLKAGEEIGEEVHPTTDQFFRIEEGKGRAVIYVGLN